MSARIYFAPLVMGILLLIASRQHHETREDVDVYRFPPVLIYTLCVCVGVSAMPVLGTLAYYSHRSIPNMYEYVFYCCLFGSVPMIAAAQLWVCIKFTLELRVGTLTVTDWRGRRFIRFDDIRKIMVAYPWRGRGYIDLFDESRKLERIDGGVQDFEEVAAFIINQSASGTIICERHPGEAWTQRVITS